MAGFHAYSYIPWRGTAGHYRHVRTYKAINARSARSAIIVIPEFASWRMNPSRIAYTMRLREKRKDRMRHESSPSQAYVISSHSREESTRIYSHSLILAALGICRSAISRRYTAGYITWWLSPSVIAIIAIYSRRVTSDVQRFADRMSTRGTVPLSERVRRISR